MSLLTNLFLLKINYNRSLAATYAKETKELFKMMVKAILESLEIDGDEDEAAKELEEGSQLVVVNCYPPCPEPELTLGMPPHSDYGFLTLLLQDDVEGLQILYRDEWVTVDPIPSSFVVNVGDHLEVLIIILCYYFLRKSINDHIIENLFHLLACLPNYIHLIN